MKKSLLLVTLLLPGLAGCGEDRNSRQIEEIDRLRSDLEQIRSEMQSNSNGWTSGWKTRGLVAVSLGAVMLFIGAGLGAGARRDARKPL